MEQRALLAVGLVAGCVTAAGAGGYLAVRQLAAPVVPAATHAVVDDSAATAGGVASGGTEAELSPASAPPEAPSVEPSHTPSAIVTQAPAAAPEPRPRRAVASPPTRPAPPAAARPAPQATVARTEPVRRDPVGASPSSAPASLPRDSQTLPRDTSSNPVDAEARGRDTWPARDPEPARDDRVPSRDGAPASASNDTAPLPARSSAVEPTTPPEPVRRLETVTIPADAVIGVQIETTTTSETARVEDTVRARVTRDVLSRGTVVVPAGSRLIGSVTLVEDGGRIRERARLGVRFHTLVLADGTEVRLPTETIYRDGESPAKQSAAKIGGGAAGGAILGAILGGTRGAIIGAATGAGGGTAAAMAGSRRPAELRSGQAVTVRVSDDVETQVER